MLKIEMTENKLKEKYMNATAQITHLVFCRHTKSKHKKTKRAISCQTHTEELQICK